MNVEVENGDAWIAYIDIYGFSARVEKDSAAATYRELADCIKDIAELVRSYDFILQALSDSIFIICFLGGRHGSDPFPKFIHCLREAQDKLVAAKFLPRGALTRGEVYISPGIIVGEPVIRAVRDEQSVDIPCFVIPSRELRGIKSLRHETMIPVKGGGVSLYVPLFPESIEPYQTLVDERMKESLLKGPATVAAAMFRLKEQIEKWINNERNRNRSRKPSLSSNQKSKTPRTA